MHMRETVWAALALRPVVFRRSRKVRRSIVDGAAGTAGAGVTVWAETPMAARSRGKLCRAIARDPIEGLGPEGGARP